MKLSLVMDSMYHTLFPGIINAPKGTLLPKGTELCPVLLYYYLEELPVLLYYYLEELDVFDSEITTRTYCVAFKCSWYNTWVCVQLVACFRFGERERSEREREGEREGGREEEGGKERKRDM